MMDNFEILAGINRWLFTYPCVGGPLHDQFKPGPADRSDWVFEDGKYIFTPSFTYRHGDCWLWHKFIR